MLRDCRLEIKIIDRIQFLLPSRVPSFLDDYWDDFDKHWNSVFNVIAPVSSALGINRL